MVLFFMHIPFVVNHTTNATPPERLQQYTSPDYTQGRTQGGGWGYPPLELDILQKLDYLRKEIKCFRIHFAF